MQRPGIKTELFTVNWDRVKVIPASGKFKLALSSVNETSPLFPGGGWILPVSWKALLAIVSWIWGTLVILDEYLFLQKPSVTICKKNYRKSKGKGNILQCLNNTHHSTVGTWSLRKKGLYSPSGFQLGWISILAQMEGCGYKGCGVWPVAGAVEGPGGSCSLLRQTCHSSPSLPQDQCDQGNIPTYCTKGWHKIFKN